MEPTIQYHFMSQYVISCHTKKTFRTVRYDTAPYSYAARTPNAGHRTGPCDTTPRALPGPRGLVQRPVALTLWCVHVAPARQEPLRQRDELLPILTRSFARRGAVCGPERWDGRRASASAAAWASAAALASATLASALFCLLHRRFYHPCPQPHHLRPSQTPDPTE